MPINKPKHPKGLPILFLTEMWERFGYYLLLGILLLYLKDPKGGFGYENKEASDIVGTYLGLVYLTPFVGGLLADKILGYRRSIILGGLLMSAGYFCLAVPNSEMFWIAVLLLVIGNGFFKPNISTLLGNLYNNETNKSLKDDGYNIFYMSINVGAFICNFVAAYMRNAYGWGYAFAAAGIGMLIGVLFFIGGNKHIKAADIMKPAKPEDMSISKVLWIVIIPMLIFGVIGWLIPGNIFGSDSTDAFIIACIPVIGFYINLLIKSNKDDKSRIAALLSIFAVVIVFWAVFKQNASALTNYAETYTDRQISAETATYLKPFGMVQEISIQPDTFPKYDAYFRPVKNVQGEIETVISPNPYFQNLDKNNWPKENQPIQLISTEIFQSINPFFIVLLTPLVISLFSLLRRRKREPSTPAKIAWGLLITGISTAIMAFAIYSTDITQDKSSAWWLIGSYAVVTIGELFLSPIGLSLVSKVAPARLTSLLMGGWFLATAIGNKLSGVLSSLWDNYDHKANFFWVNFTACLIASLIIFAMIKWLRSIIQQHT
ncbi:peptide MFS transporter [Olivibacter domesticus]|uniref:Proton-dependent oligopeptide transporter, POT family n=1 Tax=Olivibacter domesticus TaxID=407022 RepID=A0A1H7X1S4_OLID1|nr:peptide MFS transporter [Olivibacter domesticus]SEM27038.1 proton-dependent oligopeptide transporter, POT family [Olivibacter domesticus]